MASPPPKDAAISFEDACNPLDFIKLGYMNQVYETGAKKTLELEDLGAVSRQDDCKMLYGMHYDNSLFLPYFH